LGWTTTEDETVLDSIAADVATILAGQRWILVLTLYEYIRCDQNLFGVHQPENKGVGHWSGNQMKLDID
jgi:hypothetical protein